MKTDKSITIAVMDYSTATIHTYRLIGISADKIDDDLLESLGLFKSNSCYWMVVSEIIHHYVPIEINENEERY